MQRRPLQGLITVVRFNWHLFAIALFSIASLVVGACYFTPAWSLFCAALAVGVTLVICTSLAATIYAYDLTGLYSLRWLDPWVPGAVGAVNIHAGFDETSSALRLKYPAVEWHLFDFHDPSKHTEVSIRRARAAYPTHPGTRRISTDHIPLENQSVDRIILVLAAHEIRDRDERVRFFREIRRVLSNDGCVVVTEHLRDLPNIIAYTAGAWHFHPRSEWLDTFKRAGFHIAAETKNNLLITTFILKK